MIRRRGVTIADKARPTLVVHSTLAKTKEGELKRRIFSRTEELDRLNQHLQNEIHQRRQAEYALKESETKYRSIIENATEGIFQTSPEGRLIMVNQAGAELLGYRSPEECKNEITDIKNQLYVDPDQRRVFKQLVETNLLVRGFETQFRRKDSAVIDVAINAHLVKDGVGNIAYYEGMIQDISERKRSENMRIAKEAAETANRAKSAFLANMSHEIRTPMNAVIGLSELALQTKMTAQQRDYLNKIHGSAVALLGIINDILDFSKIEAGKLELECIDFDLQPVLDQLSDMLSATALEKKIELLVFIEPGVPRRIKADPLRLGQVLINLTANAVKFTEKGEVIVRVSLISKENGKVRLLFSIRDSGTGIAPEYLPQLGTSFSQADLSTTRRRGGTGLGLAISRQLVQLMRGELNVVSTPGLGSDFFFSVPFEESTEPLEISTVHDSLSGKHVLVVDDNAQCREVYSQMLESMDICAASADSGLSALDAMGKAVARPFDMILLDGAMPGMDGIETLESLRRLPQLKDTPVVMMIADERESEFKRAQAAGVHSFLIKPVKQSEFLEIVSRNLSPKPPGNIENQNALQAKEAFRFEGRILIVEDLPINLQVAVEMSKNLGLEVDTAHNGHLAMEMLSSTTYDLVLMDVQMPGIDGLTVTRRLRANPLFQTLPIIAMTAHALSGSREIFIAAGMNDVVHKPIDTDKLRVLFKKWLKPTECPPLKKDELPDTPVQWDMPKGLNGIDLKEAKVRFPDVQFYRSLLISFAHQHGNDVKTLRALISSGNNEEAMFLIHGFKGVTQSICAEPLHTMLENLESAISGGRREDVHPKLDRMERAMHEILTAIGSLEAAEGIHGQDTADVPVDLPSLRQSLFQLEEMLGSNNLAAESLFQQIAPQLTRLFSLDRIVPIQDHILKLDYQIAKVAVELITQAV